MTDQNTKEIRNLAHSAMLEAGRLEGTISTFLELTCPGGDRTQIEVALALLDLVCKATLKGAGVTEDEI